MKLKELAVLFTLAALFGSSFLFVRIASPAIGPFLTSQGRVTFGALGLLAIVLLFRKSVDFRLRWKQYFIIGALNSAIPFTLVSLAAIHLNASLLAIINAMVPFFTAIAVWAWLKEKLVFAKGLGIVLGLIGVVITVGWSPVEPSLEVFLASLCSLLSTVSYAFGGVYAKKTFRNCSPLAVTTGQLVGATLLLIPITLVGFPEQTLNITPAVLPAVLGVALFSTALGYLLYYYLIEHVGPTKTVTVTFLIPPFGMIWGAIFLDEQITPGMIAGLLIILGSLALITGIGKKRSRE
ncbi:DMT family transporter [Neobacillus notoginsengisoli]|uniref:DMT family transporter n=1 Tax=Neobacillus notoginsengisoli TaxID=1578198 RepID=A0A417YYL4_9BACI|nr:DMT family transporter [Neobacillus notoginsengisoli]RHW42821.1 DMT family transporter [Neobacillus notoginsengisoli]